MGRKKQGKKVLPVRVDPNTPDKLREIAKALSYTYNKKGSIGSLLDAIASGEIIIIKSIDN